MGVYLVSVDDYNLPDITTVQSLKELNWDDVDCLIFHSTTDSNLDLGLYISSAKEKVKKVIYINSTISPLNFCLFAGLDADIYDSEELLEDEETLQLLIDEYKETGMTVSIGDKDLEVLAKSVATITASSAETVRELFNNSYWVKTLETAVKNVDNALSRSAHVNIQMVDLLKEATTIVSNLEESHEKSTVEIMKLKNTVEEIQTKTKSSETIYYGKYNVPVSVNKVLYVRVLGSCLYLNSFLLAYQHYLKAQKQYTSKILFIYPKHQVLLRKITLPRLASDTMDMMRYEQYDQIVTFEPKNTVLTSFFEKSNVNIHIVVDWQYNDDKLNGHMVSKVYGVGGFKEVEMFKIKNEQTLFPVISPPDGIWIPHIKDYHKGTEAVRRNLYYEHCKNSFFKLDKQLSI